MQICVLWLPAFQVTEVQQVKLPVVLRMIDGIHILKEQKR